jgi:hypothetical protein
MQRVEQRLELVPVVQNDMEVLIVQQPEKNTSTHRAIGIARVVFRRTVRHHAPAARIIRGCAGTQTCDSLCIAGIAHVARTLTIS